MSDKYQKNTQRSVTVFVYCGDKYLFLKRNLTKRVDPGRLNGVGGRLEPGENYLDAAIRETKEETGYEIKPDDIKLAGVVSLEDGYETDWAMCFFKIKVETTKIPLGEKTDDGELMWIDKDKVLDSEFELVDDITYCFKDIVEEKNQFFLTCQLNDKQKVVTASIGRLELG
jgi:8-oxo-dGTP pyrophosphatase MutT (NUDIX family)